MQDLQLVEIKIEQVKTEFDGFTVVDSCRQRQCEEVSNIHQLKGIKEGKRVFCRIFLLPILWVTEGAARSQRRCYSH